MIRIRVLAAASAVLLALLACASPLATPQPMGADQLATGVALTLQALASPLPSSAPTNTPAPVPTPANVLPQALFFLNKDSGGRLQVFRLDPDGHTLSQITFEPVPVDAYDVSSRDGSVAYASNNQLFLVDARGAGRRMLIDGGALDDNNRWTNTVGAPVFSPDGQTLAFSHGGLNLYTLANGANTRVLENHVDLSAGFPIVSELYAPNAYSPDGSRLLINISFNEGGTYGVYVPGSGTLIRLQRADGNLICCRLDWAPNSSGLYIASSALGMVDSGLFYADAATGSVAILLPGSPPDGTYNFADAPHVGADGKLYFFFNNLPAVPTSGHTPLFLVRSGTDGVAGRTKMLPDAFENTNEILWAPDASLAIVVTASSADAYAGGQARLVYTDGRPGAVLSPFAQDVRWGP